MYTDSFPIHMEYRWEYSAGKWLYTVLYCMYAWFESLHILHCIYRQIQSIPANRPCLVIWLVHWNWIVCILPVKRITCGSSSTHIHAYLYQYISHRWALCLCLPSCPPLVLKRNLVFHFYFMKRKPGEIKI